MSYIKYFWIGLLLMVISKVNGQDDLIFSADSLYNLGNDAFNNEQFDQAIYCYERAKLLDPKGNDIAVNLQLANENLSTDIIEIEPFFLAEWWTSFSDLMLPVGWKVVSVLFLTLLLLLIYFHYFKNKLAKKGQFNLILGLLVLLFLLSVFAGYTRSNQIFHSPYAIVFGEDQSLYLGPDEVSEKNKRITGGNKLRILDEDGEWYKVSTMDSEQGWIMKQNVKLIKFH